VRRRFFEKIKPLSPRLYFQYITSITHSRWRRRRPFCLTNPGREWRDKRDAYYLRNDLLVYPVIWPRLRRIRIEIPKRSGGATTKNMALERNAWIARSGYRQDTEGDWGG
jgi:hypothetical protein